MDTNPVSTQSSYGDRDLVPSAIFNNDGRPVAGNRRMSNARQYRG
jgi:hypothetical protein